jgi:hypothetical protein
LPDIVAKIKEKEAIWFVVNTASFTSAILNLASFHTHLLLFYDYK